MRIRISTNSTAGLLVALVALIGVAAPLHGGANGCESCHGDGYFIYQNQKLYQYYQDWLTSPHKAAGVTCDQCHGGDATAPEKEAAHVGVFPAHDPKSRVNFDNQVETCADCHEEISRQFSRSDHFQAILDEEKAPNCGTCHRAMNRKPYYRALVDATCRGCHKDDTLGVLPGVSVPDLAEEILHRLNICKAYLGWTATYFESQGWPGDSQRVVDDLTKSYAHILSTGHSFNLKQSDKESIELLARLKIIFQGAWDQRKSQKRAATSASPD